MGRKRNGHISHTLTQDKIKEELNKGATLRQIAKDYHCTEQWIYKIRDGGNEMQSTGVTRPVDHLGRIVLPKELRKVLDIKDKDRLEIFTEGENIVLRKYQPGCIFCGEVNEIEYVLGKCICKGCRATINRLGA